MNNLPSSTFLLHLTINILLISWQANGLNIPNEDCPRDDENCSQYWDELPDTENVYFSPSPRSPRSTTDHHVVCIPNVALQRCNTNFSDHSQFWIWRRQFSYVITTVSKPGCVFSQLMFIWTLRNNGTGDVVNDYPQYINKSSMTIDFYQLDFGNYSLDVTVGEVLQGSLVGLSSARCLVRIDKEEPYAVIYGGTRQTVSVNQDTVLSGIGSINFDVRPDAPQELRYQWSCVDHGALKEKICKGKGAIIQTASVFTIKQQSYHYNAGKSFTVYLRVKARGGLESQWFDDSQTEVFISLINDNIRIRCMKNCKGSVNNRNPVYFRVECTGCNFSELYWDVSVQKDFNISLDKVSVYGSGTPKLAFVRDRVIRDDVKFTFEVKNRENKKKYADISIKPTTYPGSQGDASCKTDQGTGTSLFTKFTVWCTKMQDRKQHYTRLTRGTYADIILDVSEKDPYKSHLYLPAPLLGAREKNLLSAQLVDVDGVFNVWKVKIEIHPYITQVNVTEQLKNLTDVYDGKNKNFHSVHDLILWGDTQTAVQLLVILATEMEYISEDIKERKEFYRYFKRRMIQDIKQMGFDSQNEILQMIALVNYVAQRAGAEVDVKFEREAIQMCRIGVGKQLAFLQKAPPQGVVILDTASLSRHIFNCSIRAVRPNYEDLIPTRIITPITTPKSSVPISLLTEDYPDYVDADLETADRLHNYKIITEKAVETCVLMSLAISHLLVPGEPMPEILSTREIEVMDIQGRRSSEETEKGDASNTPPPSVWSMPKDRPLYVDEEITGNITNFSNVIQFARDQAKNIVFMKGRAYTSYVIPSPSLNDWESTLVDFVIIAYNTTPHWWHPDSRKIVGLVFVVNYYIEFERIKTFEKPTQILFDIGTKHAVVVNNASVTVPNDLSKWTDENLNLCMTVHRIDVRQDATLIVEFQNITKNITLQVLLIHSRRPISNDFLSSDIINETNTFSVLTFPHDKVKHGGTWAYAAVRPHPSMLKDKPPNGTFTVHYNVSFSTRVCVRWDIDSKEWTNKDCYVGRKTVQHLQHCLCTRHGMLAVLYENATSKIDKYMNIKFSLSLEISYTVFIFVCVITMIFCMLIVVGISRKFSTSSEVFFLADNLLSDLYSYLIIVRTGNKPSASTTSNVFIKLSGPDYSSRGHLLNYPDPNKKLLQKGSQNRFLLTSAQHLGILSHIELWHDSVGESPSWYCEWIFIHDLQTQEQWYFDVRNWFSVIRNESTSLTVKPSPFKRDILLRSFQTITFSSKNLWNIFSSDDDRLPFFQQVSVIFVNILTTSLFILILYGFPALRLRDGLGTYGHYDLYPEIFWIAISGSLLSFAITFGLIKLFKEGKHIKRESDKFPLPWVLTIGLIAVTCIILTVFGFWLAQVTSLLWLTSTIIAIFINIFVLENISTLVKRMLAIFHGRETIVPTVNVQQTLETVEEQRQLLYPIFGSQLLRYLFSEKYQPLTMEKWRMKRETLLTKMRLFGLVGDFFIYAVYVLLLCHFVWVKSDVLVVRSHKVMQDFLDGVFTRNMSYKDLNMPNDFYKYVNESLIPNIHPMTWYEGFHVLDPGLMADFNTKIIGVVRFRQLRACKDCCAEMERYKKFNNTACVPELSGSVNDKGKYAEYWKSGRPVLVPRLASAWKYEDEANALIGEMGIYSGGGFIAPLGRTLHNSYYNLVYYENASWIDERTRLIVIEALAFNANVGVLHVINLMIERTASGLLVKTPKIYSTKLLPEKSQFGWTTGMVMVFFIVMLILILLRNLNNARQDIINYFRNVWSYFDLCMIVASVAYLRLYFYRNEMAEGLLSEMISHRRSHFINYYKTMQVQQVYTILGSILIIAASIRLCSFLKFTRTLEIFNTTLAASAKPLFAAIICHLYAIFIFAFSGYALFGFYSEHFRSLTTSFITMFLLLHRRLIKFDLTLLTEAPYGVGYPFYTLFTVFNVAMIMLYPCILILNYNNSCHKVSNVRQYYTIRRLFRDKLCYLKDFLFLDISKPRLSAGKDFSYIRDRVTPKESKYRYKNVISIPWYKLYIMSLTAKCVIRNNNKRYRSAASLTDKDVDLMARIVFNVLGDRDIQQPRCVTIVAKDKNGETKLVNNERITKMANTVNCMLNNLQTDAEANVESVKIKSQANIQLEYFDKVLKVISEIVDNINITQEST